MKKILVLILLILVINLSNFKVFASGSGEVYDTKIDVGSMDREDINSLLEFFGYDVFINISRLATNFAFIDDFRPDIVASDILNKLEDYKSKNVLIASDNVKIELMRLSKIYGGCILAEIPELKFKYKISYMQLRNSIVSEKVLKIYDFNCKLERIGYKNFIQLANDSISEITCKFSYHTSCAVSEIARDLKKYYFEGYTITSNVVKGSLMKLAKLYSDERISIIDPLTKDSTLISLEEIRESMELE